MAELTPIQHNLIADYIDHKTNGKDRQYLEGLMENDSSFRNQFMDTVIGKYLIDALRIDIEGNI